MILNSQFLNPTSLRFCRRFIFFIVGLVTLLSSSQALTFLIEGNSNISRKKIDAVISLPEEPEKFSDEDWELWTDDLVSTVSEVYAEQGFFDAAFRITHSMDSLSKITSKTQTQLSSSNFKISLFINHSSASS